MNLLSFYAVIVLIIGVQALTEEQKEKLKTIHNECAAVTKIDLELVTKARKGEFTDDPNFKEHLFCVSKKIGFQNDAGDLQLDILKKKINKQLENDEETEKLVKLCAVQKDTPQQTAFDSLKCYYENNPKHVSVA